MQEGRLEIDPAKLVITAQDREKPFGNKIEFSGVEFSVKGLQNGETIDLVTLASLGAPASALSGKYAITASNARGGTYDKSNYDVIYADGELAVLPPTTPPPPPPPPPPVEEPVVTPEEIQKIFTGIDQGAILSKPGSEPGLGGEEQAVISTFGIQRPNPTTFFGEQLLEPGGALMIDNSGVGPPLPLGEAPGNLDEKLAEEPHDELEKAIADDDRRKKVLPRTRSYELSAGEARRRTRWEKSVLSC